MEEHVKEQQAVDVIGYIIAVGDDVVHGERKGKPNRRMVVELGDIEWYVHNAPFLNGRQYGFYDTRIHEIIVGVSFYLQLQEQ
nr:replication protein A 70 kDa DNA-binding subunit B [Tanacetum cinerariifolium]